MIFPIEFSNRTTFINMIFHRFAAESISSTATPPHRKGENFFSRELPSPLLRLRRQNTKENTKVKHFRRSIAASENHHNIHRAILVLASYKFYAVSFILLFSVEIFVVVDGGIIVLLSRQKCIWKTFKQA